MNPGDILQLSHKTDQKFYIKWRCPVVRKCVSILLSVCLMTVMMYGCGSNQPDVSGQSQGRAEDTAKSGGGKESTGESKTVKMVKAYSPAIDRFPAGEDINTNPVIDYHREKSGINIQVECLPKDNSNQQIAMILASGDVPDILELKNKEVFFKYAAQGAFMPVGDLLEQSAPHYMEITDPDLFDYVTYEDDIYAIPYCKGDYVQTHGIYARTDLLDDAGVNYGNTKTLDEFKQDLRTIKEKTGLIPLTASAFDFSNFVSTIGMLQGSFGVPTYTLEKNGKLEFSWIQPEHREYLSYMKSLYDEGLLDNEFAVNQSKHTQEKMVGERAVLSFESWWIALTIDTTLQQKNADSEVKYLQLPTGKDGISGVMAPTLLNSYFCIPTAAKEPEAAIKLLEYMATDDALFVQNYGLEGRYYTKENGKIVSSAEQAAAADFLTVYQLVDTQENFLLRQEKKGFTPYYKQISPYNKLTEPTSIMPSNEQYDGKFSELTTFVLENTVKFIMGSRGLAEYDQYVEEFNQRGGTEAIQAANEWYQQNN